MLSIPTESLLKSVKVLIWLRPVCKMVWNELREELYQKIKRNVPLKTK